MASRRAGPRDLPLLGERLEALRRDWSARRLDSDPLAFAHRFTDPGDREVVAFLAASLAFGRVASIQASVTRVLEGMGPHPAAFLEAWDEKPIPSLNRFVHRWVSGKDVEDLLRMVKRARRVHGSLGALFAAGDEEEEKTGNFLEGEGGRRAGARAASGAVPADYVDALSTFLRSLSSNLPARGGVPSRGLRFLLPSPEGGSACKRQHLFLRWMIRTEGFDLGLWTGGRFTPARLLLPMDTHVHRIATYLGLTRRKAANLAAAREATGWLRVLNPGDPVAYDWALSRLGILAECVTERTRRHCERCAVRPVCRASLIPFQGVAAA
ncbi:MAG TPA: TIGR02757 family protein [Thermoanaerobaculia bacterium]|nr:TIGR02757 family protein [Thermoanaerobaculia bacterium]